MEKLTQRERDLVALGAAIGSNRDIKGHTGGLSDAEIAEATRIAEKTRREPDAAKGCCSGRMPC